MIFLLWISFLFFILSLFFRKRNFDFITIYGICLCLFNVTTVSGYVIDPNSRKYIAAGDELIFVTALIFIFTTPFFYFKSKEVLYFNFKSAQSQNGLNSVCIYLLLFISSFFLLSSLPSILNASNKREVLENGGIIFSLIGALPVVGAFFSYKLGKNKLMFIFLSLVALIFLLGSRRPAALLFLGFVLLLANGKKVRIITYWKFISCSMIGFMFLILGKSLYSFILIYGFSGFSVWLNNFNPEFFLSGSEFLSTPGILNALINSNLSLSTEHIIKSIAAIQPIPLSYFGFSSSAFNDFFQKALFPDLDYGMAYNPWAEAYAWAGYFGVIIYAILIPVSIRFLWFKYCSAGPFLSSSLLIVGVLVSFWIHRNSLGSELAYIRNAIYPLIFIYLISRFVLYLIPRK